MLCRCEGKEEAEVGRQGACSAYIAHGVVYCGKIRLLYQMAA
jgi:hypothetical protein